MACLPTSNRVFNRQSVQSAIKSTQQRLKLYNGRCPQYGLAIFCGLATTEQSNGKEKQVTVNVEPSRPIKRFVYRCDNHFHTEDLDALLKDDTEERYGFIVMDGNGTLFGVVQGSNKEVVKKIAVDLPKKQRKGGQSAPRFERIRQEKRQLYTRKVAELACDLFISTDMNQPNVKGIVLAGSAGLKDDLSKSNVFDKRLSSIVIKTIDVSHGGGRGFDEAIDLSADELGSVKLVQEKHLLERYMNEISRDTGRYCIAVHETIQALEMSSVERLIVWDDLKLIRYELHNKKTGEQTVRFGTSEEEEGFQLDVKTGDRLELLKKEPLVDWICENYKSFGCELDLVSDQTAVGNQFVMGFGGIGGLLRWKIDFLELNGYNEEQGFGSTKDSDDDDKYDFDDDGGYSF